MIGPSPYKIVYDLIRHDDAINGRHTWIARSESAENLELDRLLSIDEGADPSRLQVYRTDINGYGVVMGRERVSPEKGYQP